MMMKFRDIKSAGLLKVISSSIMLALYLLGINVLSNLEKREAEQERKALVDLYHSTNGDQWNTKWNLQTPVSEWHGIRMVDGKVVEINLFRNNLRGHIPQSIGDLKHLKKLDIGFNNVSGKLPTDLAKLSDLKILKFEMNNIEGDILTQIAKLKNLEEFSAFNNLISGKVPPSLGEIKKLKILNLSGNCLEGKIPNTLGQLHKLESLRLYDNALSGSIPPELGNLAKLKELVLAHNLLEGEIPIDLGKLTNLVVFQIQHNRFDSFKNLKRLESKKYFSFDYDRKDAAKIYRDINAETLRWADTKFEDGFDN